jgi:hypothetical protein
VKRASRFPPRRIELRAIRVTIAIRLFRTKSRPGQPIHCHLQLPHEFLCAAQDLTHTHLQSKALKTIEPVDVASLIDVSIIQGDLTVVHLDHLTGRLVELDADQHRQVWQLADGLADRMGPSLELRPQDRQKIMGNRRRVAGGHNRRLIQKDQPDPFRRELTNRAVELAMAGDASVMRALLDRLIAHRKDRPVSLKMPKINSASDLVAAAASLTSAVADGEITPSEAASLSTLVANTAKAVETFEIVERLTRLEEQVGARSNP